MLTVGCPATGTTPSVDSTRRNTSHTNAPNGFDGACAVFNPNNDNTPANKFTTGESTPAGPTLLAGATMALAAATDGVVTDGEATDRVVTATVSIDAAAAVTDVTRETVMAAPAGWRTSDKRVTPMLGGDVPLAESM